jgi:hypothetical protein
VCDQTTENKTTEIKTNTEGILVFLFIINTLDVETGKEKSKIKIIQDRVRRYEEFHSNDVEREKRGSSISHTHHRQKRC